MVRPRPGPSLTVDTNRATEYRRAPLITVIDLTKRDQGPDRKKVKLADTPPTTAQPDAASQPSLVSIPSHVDSSIPERSSDVQLLPSVSSASFPDPVSGKAGATQTVSGPPTKSKRESVDANYEELVDAIIEEPDEEGKRICKLCSMRYAVNLIKELPKPWIGASFDELVSHCRNDHPIAWQQLMEGDENEDEDEGEEVAQTS